MAWVSPSSNQTSPWEKHLSCSICLEVFQDPVTTVCGHSFCRSCLDRKLLYCDMTCPLCKKYLTYTPQVNIILRDIIQELRCAAAVPGEFTGAPGEVACDTCTSDRKLRAHKSCLVCLASYCPAHLELHFSAQRLRGHKMVEPVENLDARACLAHGRPLELYSRKRQACVCVRCIDGSQDEFVSTETEWSSKKDRLGKTKIELEQKIDERRMKVKEVNDARKSCKDLIDNEWWEIDGVFNIVLAIVESAQKVALQPLSDRRQLLEKEAKDLKEDLEAEINQLEAAIFQLDDISVLEDHVLFLQRYPSLQDLAYARDWADVHLDTEISFGTMRRTTATMMEKIHQELEKLTSIELTRISTFKEDVKLDPTTAHRRLVVSSEGKEVTDGGEDQNVSDNPGRFDMVGSVLGLEGFSSGRVYWEVGVGDKTGWDLGVARASATRRGRPRVNPGNGYWVVAHYEGQKYAALTSPPARLRPEERPQTVGVFVDYEEDLVSFYDPAARSHIFSFTECSFKDKIVPYFGPHARRDETNSEPLVIFSDSEGGKLPL